MWLLWLHFKHFMSSSFAERLMCDCKRSRKQCVYINSYIEQLCQNHSPRKPLQNKYYYAIEVNVLKVQWSSICSLLVSLSLPSPPSSPPSLTSSSSPLVLSVSRPLLYLTLQSTEESSNCIRQGENRSNPLLCWIWARNMELCFTQNVFL